MKAVVFYGKNDLRLEEVAMPEVGDNEVLVQVKACGICGTDWHIYEGAEGAAACIPPKILGHEFSGVVQQVGVNVTRVKVGDRVCVDPNNLCGECFFCQSGKGHFCENMLGYGTNQNGGFAEFCVVPEKQVYLVSSTLSFAEAAMAEPVACCLHGMDLTNVQQGNTVLIIGAGPIGLIMTGLAKLAGAGTIIVVEPVLAKRECALALGADLAVSPEEDVLKRVAEHGVLNVDHVIECVGKGVTVAKAIEYAGNCATVMLFGLTEPDAVVGIKPFELFKKELHLTASFINPYTMGRAVALLNSGRLDLKPIITATVPLLELPAYFADSGGNPSGKTVVLPSV